MKKIIMIFLIVFSMFSLIGCSEPFDPDAIVAISINPDTLPEKIENTQVMKFIDGLALIITYADGSEDYIDFDKSMITDEEYLALYSIGVHNVVVKYLGLETQFTIEVCEKSVDYYKVIVVYPDDTKVTDSINIRWIQNTDFYKSSTLIEGESTIVNDQNEYLIHLFKLPAGYTYNPNIYKVNSEVNEVVIKLIPLFVFSEGNGSKNDPYIVLEGTYVFSYDVLSLNGMKIYSFTPTESGEYTIESFAEDKYPSNSCDPYFGFFGETIDFGSIDYSGNQESYVNINFKYTFNAEKGKTYYFMVFISLAADYPASFNVSIYR